MGEINKGPQGTKYGGNKYSTHTGGCTKTQRGHAFFLLSESKIKNKQKENTVPVQSIRIPLSLHSVTRSTLIVITVGINVTLSVFTCC